MKFNNRLLYFYILIVVLLVVLPINGKGSKMNHTFIFSLRLDYLLHGIIFFPWMSFLILNERLMKPFFWLIAGLFFAFLAEGVQYFLPYRAFNINDVIGNFVGVFMGTMVLFFHKRFFSIA